MALAATNTLADRFAWLFDGLCKAIFADAHKRRTETALAWAILTRVLLLGDRFLALAARVRDGRLPARRPPPSCISPQPEPTPPQTSKSDVQPRALNLLPQPFGWIARLLPETTEYIGVLRFLLRDPELAALVEKAPQAARILRPLCHLLGVPPPAFLRPGAAPVTPPPSQEPAPAAEAPEPSFFAEAPPPPVCPPAPEQSPPTWQEQEAVAMRERVAAWVKGRVDPPSTLLPLGVSAGNALPDTYPAGWDSKNRG